MISECLHLGLENCWLSDHGQRRQSNLHHIYWPAHRYTTPIETAFRNMVEHTVQMCVCDHNLLHIREQPPRKPPLLEMLAALSVDLAVQMPE